MAQVSCELVAPKESRPNEGIMFFNIELSPMSSPAFEQGRWESYLWASLWNLINLLHHHQQVFLCLQTVWIVSEAQQAAGEMLKELQVHWYWVTVCGVWRKGKTQKEILKKCILILTMCVFRCGRSEWTFTSWITMGTWWMLPALLLSQPCLTSDALMSALWEMKSQWWEGHTWQETPDAPNINSIFQIYFLLWGTDS